MRRLNELAFFLLLISVASAQQFRVGWYSPEDHTSQSHPAFKCYDSDPGGSFTSIGINTLLAYKQGIYQVYNGNSLPMDLRTLISNTSSYLSLYPSQKIILDISAAQHIGSDISNMIFRSNSDVTKYVNLFTNNPQVVGWYIADEPEQSWANTNTNPIYYGRDALVNRYNLVKSISSKDVFVAVASVDSFRNKYGDGTFGRDSLPRVAKFYDVLMVDHYPVLLSSHSLNGCRWNAQLAKATVENDANTSSSLFYFVAQGQGNNQNDDNGTGGFFGMDDPTMHEMRYMVMSPMLWGAKGILFWSYANASRRGNDFPSGYPVDSWRTVHRFTQWFASPTFYYNLGTIYGTTPEADAPLGTDSWIRYRIKNRTQTDKYIEYFVFSVNESQNSQNGSVTLPQLPSPSWSRSAVECQYNASQPGQTYDLSQSISSDNKISGSWAGYEVKVFKVIYQLWSGGSQQINGQGVVSNPSDLLSVYPNPFNPSTMISFTLTTPARVNISVVDVLGRKVADLVNGEMEPGVHNAAFKANGLSSGVFYVRFHSADRNGAWVSHVSRIILTK